MLSSSITFDFILKYIDIVQFKIIAKTNLFFVYEETSTYIKNIIHKNEKTIDLYKLSTSDNINFT